MQEDKFAPVTVLHGGSFLNESKKKKIAKRLKVRVNNDSKNKKETNKNYN